MNRRRYLATVWAIGIGSGAGCVTPRASNDRNATASETDDDHEYEYDGYEDRDDHDDDQNGTAYVVEDFVELELLDRFVLDDSGIAVVVTETVRRESDEFDVDAPDRDVFVVRMTIANETDDPAELDHELFWLEGLDPEESGPDTDLSAALAEGASGATTRLTPGEERTLELAFAIPQDLEPRYLWAERYYVCLV